MSKTYTGYLSVAAAALFLAGCGRPLAVAPVSKAGAIAAQARAAEARPNELVVAFKSATARQATMQRLGLRTLAKVEALDAVVVKAEDATSALKALKADPAVRYAEPNYIARASVSGQAPKLVLGGDELLPKLWGLTKIGAEQAWGVTRGKGVKVAVVDTGIDYTHSDLKDRVIDKGRDFAGSNPDAMDDHYHGTHCAGTVAASLGNGGLAGVAPEASLIAVKVLGADGSGSYAGVANGIVYAADAGAQVISMSLGGRATAQVIEDAVKHAQAKGALVVAAMGNEGSTTPSYPAALPGVLAVGATNSDDRLPNFTNCGPHISVTAPGVEILSTVPGGYDELSGTSMATPHVSGLAALLKAKHPGWGAKEIRAAIEGTVDDKGLTGYDIYFGHGRIHAGRALTSAR